MQENGFCPDESPVTGTTVSLTSDYSRCVYPPASPKDAKKADIEVGKCDDGTDPKEENWVLAGLEQTHKSDDMVTQMCVNDEEKTGYIVYVAPYMVGSIIAEGGASLVIASFGIGVEVEILRLQLHLAQDFGIAGGEMSKTCSSGQFTIGSGGGRVYFFVDTIFTSQAEFNLFSWDGLSYTWPDGGDSFWGKCGDIDHAYDETDPAPGVDILYKKVVEIAS